MKNIIYCIFETRQEPNDIKPDTLQTLSVSPEKDKPKPTTIPHKIDKKPSIIENQPIRNTDEPLKHKKPSEKTSSNGDDLSQDPLSNRNKVDEDFERLQEDLVLKLVVDEETAPKTSSSSAAPPQPFEVTNVQPPPNLAPPQQDKWYYQDPQGTRQGPFPNHEMAEWYKAGYFSNQLNVMRECDERYFLLGELITLCGGENPFLANIRLPVLKNDAPKTAEDVLPYQFLTQLAFQQQQASMRNLAEPWSALTLQQQELATQRLLLQQQQQQQVRILLSCTFENI